MYSLTEITFYSTPAYLQYFSKKIGFLLADDPSGAKGMIRWLWRHIGHIYNFSEAYSSLNSKEREALLGLFNSFGYVLTPDETLVHLEKKISWVFRHPAGGVFVPLEIFKLLMQEEELFKMSYLFTLLYKMNAKERRNLASFCGSSLEGQLNITFETNQLDMALVLYIWYSAQVQEADFSKEIIPPRGKILSTPYSFTRETKTDLHTGPEKVQELPAQPVSMWDYLFQNFGQHKNEVEKLYTLVTKGNKGFYRSLVLLSSSSGQMVEAFRRGALMPVIAPRSKNAYANMKVVSPMEFRYYHDKNAHVKEAQS